MLYIFEVFYVCLENLDGVLKEGDEIKVKFLGIDVKIGKFKFFCKVLIEKFVVL